jgi:hypothetical protein
MAHDAAYGKHRDRCCRVSILVAIIVVLVLNWWRTMQRMMGEVCVTYEPKPCTAGARNSIATMLERCRPCGLLMPPPDS